MNSTSTMNPTTSGDARNSTAPSAVAPRRHERDGLVGASAEVTPEVVAHSEGVVARTIEKQTAKLPSDVFLWAALGSMGVSLGMHLAGKKENSLFVGQWAAPFLLMGVYNKLVKIGGSDRIHN